MTITYQGTNYDYSPSQMNYYMTVIIKSDKTYQFTVTDKGTQWRISTCHS